MTFTRAIFISILMLIFLQPFLGGESKKSIDPGLQLHMGNVMPKIQSFYQDLNTKMDDSIWEPISISVEEKKWLNKREEVTVFMGNYPPYMMWKDGQPSGIIYDYFEELARQIDLDFTIQKKLLTGDITELINTPNSIIIGINETTIHDGLRHTLPYTSLQTVLVLPNTTRDIISIKDLSGKKLAVGPGFTEMRSIESRVPNIEFHQAQSVEHAIDQTQSGLVDATILDGTLASWYIQKHKIFGLKLIGDEKIIPWKITMGISENAPELRSILNKGIAATPKSVFQKCYQKYVSINIQYGLSFSQKMTMAVIILLLIITVLLILFVKNNQHKKHNERREERIRTVMNSIDDLIIATDKNGLIQSINEAAKKVFSITEKSELNILDLLSIRTTSTLNQILAFETTVKKTSSTQSLKNSIEIISTQGTSLIYDLKASPIFDHKHELNGFVYSMVNITNSKKKDLELKEANFRLTQAEEIGKIGWFMANTNQKKAIGSENAFQLWGINSNEWVSFKNIFHKGNPFVLNLEKELLSIQIGDEYETTFSVMQEKQIRWIHCKIQRVWKNEEEEKITFGLLQDITDWKNSELSLAENAKLFKGVFDNSPIGRLLYTNSGKCISINQACNSIFSITNKSDLYQINLVDLTFVPKDILEKIKHKEDVQYLASFHSIEQKVSNEFDPDAKKFLDISITHYNRAGKDEDAGILIMVGDKTSEQKGKMEIKKRQHQIRLASKGAKIGFFSMNLLKFDLDSDDQFNENLKIEIGKNIKNNQEILQNIHPCDFVVAKENWNAILKGEKKSIVQEFNFTTKKQNRQLMLIATVTEFDPDKERIIVTGVLQNITELRNTQKRFDISQTSGNIGSWIYDLSKKRFWGSNYTLQLIGLKQERNKNQFHPKAMINIFENPKQSWQKFIEVFLTKNSKVKETDFIINTESDHQKIFQIKGSLEFDSQQNPIAIHGVILDVSEQRRIERELIETKLEKETILEHISTGITLFSPELDVLWYNKKAAKIYKIENENSQEELRKCYDLFLQKEVPCFPYKTQQTMNLKESIQRQRHLPNGQHYWITSVPIFDSKGQLKGVVETADEITELINKEEELSKAKDKALESDRLKSAFLANMSHEIRTPLNGIVGFSKLLGMDKFDKNQRKGFVEIINKNNEILLHLINDVLDLSKIESGTFELNAEKCHLDTLVKNIIEIQSLNLNQNVEFIYEPIVNHLTIETDTLRLNQVLTNLVSNAKKFTKQGHIKIKFHPNYEEKRLYFSVEDTGVGIPKDQHKHVFDRFVKLNSFIQGTGLGLSISKLIIEQMNGNIWVDSSDKQGSKFTFYLPFEQLWVMEAHRSEEEEKIEYKPVEIPENSKKPTILIAEDTDHNFKLFEMIINKEYDITRAENGQKAVDIFKVMKPNIIFMDLKMPIMDGLEATKMIRTMDQNIPIVALTAHARENEKQKSFQAGCDHYITKPYESSQIFDAIRRYTSLVPSE